MTDSNATELLRKLLDERGVEYTSEDVRNDSSYKNTAWSTESGDWEYHDDLEYGLSWFEGYNIAPEQAIAATLGAVDNTRITELEAALNEVADKWAQAQIKAEDLAKENRLLKANDGSHWHELFGTPERAVETVVYMFGCKDFMPWVACKECPILGACELRHCDHDALLEWLRGKAVKR